MRCDAFELCHVMHLRLKMDIKGSSNGSRKVAGTAGLLSLKMDKKVAATVIGISPLQEQVL